VAAAPAGGAPQAGRLAPSPSPSRPAARLSQPGRSLKPLPQFSHEAPRKSEPPAESEDETTIFDEPSEDDDDSETLVLVRDKLPVPKKHP
jgi:hypothetical protein